MVDLVEIGMKVDSSDFVKAAVNTKDFEVAVAKMVQTVIRETKIMDNVVKASTEARAEAEARVVQNIIIEHQKLTAAKQKEAERQQALAERQIKEEQSAWFAAQRRRLSLMQESQRIEEKRISDEIKASQSALKQQQKEEAEIKAKAEAIKALAEAETAAYVKTTLAAEKAAAAKAAAFQKGIGGTLGLGSTNASAKGAGTGQAFIEQGLKEEAIQRDRVAQATKREADQLEYLKMKYNQIYASSQLYERSLTELNQAHTLGVTSIKQHEASLEALNLEYQNFQSGVAQAGNRFAQYSAQTATGMNKFGVAAQQTGYQVSDFLVQVQGGTNPLVAFSQQATQLAGLLYLLPPSLQAARIGMLGFSVSMATATAGLTIIIPILAMLAMSFFSSGKDAEGGAKGIDKYKNALEGLRSAIQKTQVELDKLSFGTDDPVIAAAKKAQAEAEAQLELARANQRKIGNTLAPTTEQSAALKEAVTNWTNISSIIRELEAKQKALVEAQRMLNGGLSVAGGLQRAAIMDRQEELRLAKERVITEQAAAEKAEYLKQAFHLMAGETTSLSAGLKELPPTLDKAAISAYKLAAAMADTRTAASAVLSSMVQMDAARLRKQGQVQAAAAGFVSKPELDLVGNRAAVNAARSAILEEKNAPETGVGGGGGGGIDKVQALLDSLQTQKEITDLWYEESQTTLQSASDKELEILGGKEEAKLRLLNDYRQKQYEAQQAQSQLLYQSQAGMYGALGDLLSQFGSKSKGAAIAALAIQKGLSIGQIIVSTAAAQMRALAELGPIAGSVMAAKIGLMGKLQVGLVAATGLMQAGSIMSGNTGGGSGGKSSDSPASVGTSTTAAPATPLSVMIQGIKPTDIFTGEQLSTLFDSLYKENRNRGMVFQVAR